MLGRRKEEGTATGTATGQGVRKEEGKLLLLTLQGEAGWERGHKLRGGEPGSPSLLHCLL